MATERQLQSQIAKIREGIVGSGGITSDVKKYAAEVAAGTKTLADVTRELNQAQTAREASTARLDAMRLAGRENIASIRARQAQEAAGTPAQAQAQAALQTATQRVAQLTPNVPVVEPKAAPQGGTAMGDRSFVPTIPGATTPQPPLPPDFLSPLVSPTAPGANFLTGGANVTGGVDRATAENLVRNAFQTIFNRQPLQGGLDYWTSQLMSGAASPADLFTRVAEGAQGEDVAAAQRWMQANLGQTGPTLTPSPLAVTGETEIDPAIAPYLQEALGVARNLFLTGEGPQLYPGQMYVSPSEQTLQALQQAEALVTSPQAQQLSQQGLEAYGGALGGLQSMARGDYLQSPEYQRYLESVTRPVTEQLTQQILPSIASQYSAAGRYGSGAMQQATGKATELGTRALGDVTAQVAQQQQGRMLEAQTSLPNFLSQMPSVLQGALAPSTALAGIGGQREAIAAQPLQEAIQRFEYGQQLPYSQLSGYLSSIYGSPLGRLTQPNLQSNTMLQDIGGVLNIAGAIPRAVEGVQSGISGVKQGINWLSGVLG